MQLNNERIQYTKTIFGLDFMEMISSPRLGLLRRVFLDNHLTSNDDLTKTTKRQHIPTKTNNT